MFRVVNVARKDSHLMHDELYFVQFLHPGGEHKPDRGLISKEWNTSQHRRKFLKQAGSYVSGGKVHNGLMLFWGEWEAESRVQRKIVDPVPHGPEYIYEPYYVVPKSYDKLQNTDPFVFGKQFHYTFCGQFRPGLRHLAPGSIVLFGSRKDSSFVLDALFVVGEHRIDHTRVNYRQILHQAISREYEEVTVSPMYHESLADTISCSRACSTAVAQETWRLYYGATYDRPLLGMYSFFPCTPYDEKSPGFARPKITLPAKIVENLSQGVKYSALSSLDEMKLLWDTVAGQVTDQFPLALGVYAEMPERCVSPPSTCP